ncbi:hypothetical protein GTU73_01530 [Rathayibacter sp. VKM Ac-2804]|uniref:hypothetical protein n=1 Tax=Rathayibacter sp. VKM Ac-2804 TaxID=2609257 RepID=UPI00132ED433|nr:hypothetical protein [Rathayibacter sp. VKM Ac-2804]QHF22812.1 hypothetical protein GTU73_01530 [Rathayibacter sp. VKM Ac-2804]
MSYSLSKKAAATTVAAFTLGIGGIAALAPSAQAVTETTSYTVLESKVCKDQGNWGASYYNFGDPYSGYCYDLGFPPTLAGSLDIQAYCDKTHPGSVAVVTNPNWAIGSWACQITRQLG